MEATSLNGSTNKNGFNECVSSALIKRTKRGKKSKESIMLYFGIMSSILVPDVLLFFWSTPENTIISE